MYLNMIIGNSLLNSGGNKKGDVLPRMLDPFPTLQAKWQQMVVIMMILMIMII